MMKEKMKRWVAVALCAGVLFTNGGIEQLTYATSAEEQVGIEETVVQEDIEDVENETINKIISDNNRMLKDSDLGEDKDFILNAEEKSDETVISLDASGNFISGSVDINGHIDWVIDSNRKLIVKGTGEISDITGYSRVPWWSYTRDILSAEISISGIKNISYLLYDCINLTNLNLSNFDTSNVTDMSYMFGYCSNLTCLDLSNFNTSSVTNMSGMFAGCRFTNLDLSNFDTSRVVNMHGMFNACYSLTNLDLSNFNTSNIIDMSSMFDHCSNLTCLNLNNFDTSNVINMYGMFFNCSSLESLDLSSFSNVSGVSSMFRECSSLTSLNLSNFDTSNVSDMSSMFLGCNSLKSLDLSGFDTSNVTDMSNMFRLCSNLTSLDLSSFDIKRTRKASYMFLYCTNLNTIYIPYNISISIELPVESGDIWYRSDGTAITRLPGHLSYSVVLGKNYIPKEKNTKVSITEFKIPESATAKVDTNETAILSGALTFSDDTELTPNVLEKEIENIIWISSDTNIAEATNCSGQSVADTKSAILAITITPYNIGTATIIGTTSNGLVAACEVTVTDVDVSIRYGDLYGSDNYRSLSAIYSNRYFTKSSYTYNHNLAWLSLCVELSSGTANTGAWGESGSDMSDLAKERYANIADAYRQMEFDSAEYYNYGASLNDKRDKVAYSIASKSSVGDSTLVAVIIRADGYGCEWVSNVNVGDDLNYHAGFNTAAEEVYSEVVKHISAIDGNVKLWITGYSRSAAVANLLAAKMDDYARTSGQLDENSIFAYTFATPQGVTNNQNTTDALYENIFNIINPGDIVPMVAPSRWGFARYGVTKYFNSFANADTLKSVESMYSWFVSTTPDNLLDAKKIYNDLLI